jgi:hypothetical protein
MQCPPMEGVVWVSRDILELLLGVGRMLSAGGGSGATSPSRRVQRDWMAFILLGDASWMPAMVAVILTVASMILLVAVIARTGMA